MGSLRLGVVGSGHVGVVQCASLVQFGHDVGSTAAQQDRALQSGESLFFEPGLQDLLEDGTQSRRLRFTGDLSCVPGAAAVLICLGTPPVPAAKRTSATTHTRRRTRGGNAGSRDCARSVAACEGAHYVVLATEWDGFRPLISCGCAIQGGTRM